MENTLDGVQEQANEADSTTLEFGQGQSDALGTQEQENGQVNNYNWQEDKRYSSHWGEDPNKMYESLKYYEKRDGDFSNQINDYKNKLSEYEKYKADYESLEQLFEKPGLGDELINTIENYKNQGMSKQQKSDVNSALMSRLESVEQFKNSLEEQANIYNKNLVQQEQFKEIDNFAKKFNINYDKDRFVNAMGEMGVDPSAWSHYFRSQAADIALKNHGNSAAQNALKRSAMTPSLSSQATKTLNNSNRATYADLRRTLGIQE